MKFLQNVSVAVPRIHSVKALTEPEEFHFATDDVLRNRKIQKIREAIKESKAAVPSIVTKNDDGSLHIPRQHSKNTALESAASRVCIVEYSH